MEEIIKAHCAYGMAVSVYRDTYSETYQGLTTIPEEWNAEDVAGWMHWLEERGCPDVYVKSVSEPKSVCIVFTFPGKVSENDTES